VVNVYYEHYPTFGGYFLSYIFYFILIPAVILIIIRAKWGYIQERRWKHVLKPLAYGLIIGFFLTALLQLNLTNDYIYLYSLTGTGTCFTSSCLVEEMQSNTQYKFNVEGIERFGMPKFGIMRSFRLSDRKYNKLKFKYDVVNSVVITRSIPLLPIVEVWDYKVDPTDRHTITDLQKFYILYPYDPATLLSRHYNFSFTMFMWDVGGAP